MTDPCPTCPAADIDAPCFGRSRGLCGRPVYEALVRAWTIQGGWTEPPIPIALVVHIELCDFRTSTCGCIDKTATCRLSTQPVMMDCRQCPIF